MRRKSGDSYDYKYNFGETHTLNRVSCVYLWKLKSRLSNYKLRFQF